VRRVSGLADLAAGMVDRSIILLSAHTDAPARARVPVSMPAGSLKAKEARMTAWLDWHQNASRCSSRRLAYLTESAGVGGYGVCDWRRTSNVSTDSRRTLMSSGGFMASSVSLPL